MSDPRPLIGGKTGARLRADYLRQRLIDELAFSHAIILDQRDIEEILRFAGLRLESADA